MSSIKLAKLQNLDTRTVCWQGNGEQAFPCTTSGRVIGTIPYREQFPHSENMDSFALSQQTLLRIYPTDILAHMCDSNSCIYM